MRWRRSDRTPSLSDVTCRVENYHGRVWQVDNQWHFAASDDFGRPKCQTGARPTKTEAKAACVATLLAYEHARHRRVIAALGGDTNAK